MKGINHLVLCVNDLSAARNFYSGLGFTLCPAGQHPFGTGNTVIQLHGTYLELLAVTKPDDIIEHTPGQFSFSAFNRDYLNRHEGLSMMVLDTQDAHADSRVWKTAGLTTYEPFDFSRMARTPDGFDVKVGFSLSFVSNAAAPWLGLFSCQHYRPEYYAQPMYQSHANGAQYLDDVWISGTGALDFAPYLKTVAGTVGLPRSPGRIDLPTRFGTIILADPSVFEAAFGVPPPHPNDGPHLGGITIACSDQRIPRGSATEIGKRKVIPPGDAHGVALAFSSF